MEGRIGLSQIPLAQAHGAEKPPVAAAELGPLITWNKEEIPQISHVHISNTATNKVAPELRG